MILGLDFCEQRGGGYRQGSRGGGENQFSVQVQN